MDVWFSPKETLFLEFKLTNGSGWLTSNRLIIEHKPGKLNEGKRKDYFLKNFEKAQIKTQPWQHNSNTKKSKSN
jgi:hypothetical protein